jgi:voltage-gated potassium channel
MNKIKRYFRIINYSKSAKLIVILCVLTVLGSALIYEFDKESNKNIGSYYDALWWSIVTISTVGYGDISPVSPEGRIVAVFMMFTGIGVISMFTATIATVFVDRQMKEDKGLKKVEASQHTIICGWNYKAEEILKELRAYPYTSTQIVVIIAELDEKPVDDDLLKFVKGPVNEHTLTLANLKEAKNVIILSDETLDIRSRDANTVLNTLTVESMYPEIYSCVDIHDPRNAAHCKRAGADEIVVSGDFSAKLLARASVFHGVTHFIEDLLCYRSGSADFFNVKSADSMIGKRFVDVFMDAKNKHNATIVAIQSKDGQTFISNPPADYNIQSGDSFILVANKEPLFD